MQHDFKKFPELTNSQMELYYFQSPHKQIVESFTCRVIKVTDGDTIRVVTDFRDFDFPIRLANIAAPEIKERGGRESQKWLSSKILGDDVYVIIDPRNRVGKWGRLLGDVTHTGMSLGEESINMGHSIKFGEDNSELMPKLEVIQL